MRFHVEKKGRFHPYYTTFVADWLEVNKWMEK